MLRSTPRACCRASALSSATTPYVGGSTISNVIAADAAAVYETMTAEYEAATAEANDHGWFSTLGHLLLDVLGFIPFLGEPADGANAAWYTAEGNYTDAALSSAGMVVGVGWAAVGGKWVRPVHGQWVPEVGRSHPRVSSRRPPRS